MKFYTTLTCITSDVRVRLSVRANGLGAIAGIKLEQRADMELADAQRDIQMAGDLFVCHDPFQIDDYSLQAKRRGEWTIVL